MLLLFQCRKCGKFFCWSKHYTASVSNICCMKIITPCNINRQRILMIPCFIFYRNPEYAGKHISHSPFNSFSFILTLTMLKVKFLSYFDFSKILFSHTLYFSPPSFTGDQISAIITALINAKSVTVMSRKSKFLTCPI